MLPESTIGKGLASFPNFFKMASHKDTTIKKTEVKKDMCLFPPPSFAGNLL